MSNDDLILFLSVMKNLRGEVFGGLYFELLGF